MISKNALPIKNYVIYRSDLDLHKFYNYAMLRNKIRIFRNSKNDSLSSRKIRKELEK